MKTRLSDYQEQLQRQRENADQISGPLCIKRAKIRKGAAREFQSELRKHLSRVETVHENLADHIWKR